MTPAEHSALFESLRRRAEQVIPGCELRFGDESAFLGLLARLMRPLLRLDLRQNFVALYPHVYFPSRRIITQHPELAFKALAHELVHLMDMRQRRLRFAWGYLSPQLWALLSVLALAAPICPWALLGLLSLAALAPWPSPWRSKAELRGYVMDAAVQFWLHGSTPTPGALVGLFTGWSYYRMSHAPAKVERAFEAAYRRLRAGELPFEKDNGAFELVRALIQAQRGGLAVAASTDELPSRAGTS